MDRRHLPKAVVAFCMALFCIGLVFRLIPFTGGEERIFQQFPTEDGYLMLTIARNIALGLGMSTAEGTIPTNGTQPFTTFVWALGFLITSGSKLGGVVFAHIILIIASILFAFATYKLVFKVYQGWKYGRAAALIAAGLLFSSPQLLPHTMNFLETGLYLALGTTVILMFYTDDIDEAPWSYKKCLMTGVVLGILFLVRIDSVFIILSACLTYLYQGWLKHRTLITPHLSRVLLFGSTSIVIASPWLIYNYLSFGSVMPISGQALSAKSFAPNAMIVPSTLLEYLMLIIPIPHTIQESWPIVVFSLAVLILSLGVAIFSFINTSNRSYKALIFMGLCSLSCYICYYGMFFGAKHFVARYLSITTPFLLLFVVMIALTTIQSFSKMRRPMLYVGAIISIAIVSSLNIRIYLKAVPHQHQQVVEWVKGNVPEESWVGAIQTGTLGFFHDRSINLDGKVNPHALKAKQALAYCPSDSLEKDKKNCLMDYIVQSDIDFLVDWQGIGSWKNLTPLDKHFTLVVDQQEPSLGAFARNNTLNKSPIQ